MKLDNTIEKFCKLLYQRDINTKDDLLREILRIKISKVELASLDIKLEKEQSDKIYEIMKEKTEDILAYFPGDRELFFEMYNLGKDIEPIEFAIQIYRNDRTGKFVAPKHLTTYIQTIIDKHKRAKNVLITDVEKIMVGIKDIIENYKSKEFILTTENRLMYILFYETFKDHKNVKILHQSIYRQLLIDDNLDLIFSIPDFGTRFEPEEISKNKEFISKESDGIAVENLLDYLNKDGFLYTVVPARFAFSGGSFEKLRKYIESEFDLHSIYTMPEGTFRPYTGIKTFILEISREDTDYINIGNLILENNNFLLKEKKEVKINNFKKYNDWRIDWFLAENQDDINRYEESNVEKVKLKNVADIFRGKSIMKKDLKPGDIYVLNISNIEAGQIRYDELDTIDEEERKIKRYELEEDDLVISCRGTINKVAVYNHSKKKIIASANIIVIRFKENILSHFVKIFLESPVGQTVIKTFQRGTTVMNINPNDIGEIEIPLLAINEQQSIIEKYLAEQEQYLETVKKAEKRWKYIKDSLYEQILIEGRNNDVKC